MKYRGGRSIDPIRLWSEFCDVKDGTGPFLPLTFCPNPNHDNRRSPAFQINIERPFVHCFSWCGISGSYEHAICVIKGIYEELKVSEEDIKNAKTKFEKDEPPEIRRSRMRVRKAHSVARRIILKDSYFGKGGDTHRPKRGSRAIQARHKPDDGRVGEAGVVDERDLVKYSYLPKEAINYLESRGIDAPARTRWQLGYDEETGRITIPVFNDRNRLKFIIRRAIKPSDRPKYLIPPEQAKSSLLYGACNVDAGMVRSQGLIVVEGAIDCIRLHQHGFKNTVALLGSSPSEKQRQLIAKLRPKRIYLMLDRDAAGIKGLQKATTMLSQYQIKVPLYPKNKFDPANLTASECRRSIERAISILKLKEKMRTMPRREVLN